MLFLPLTKHIIHILPKTFNTIKTRKCHIVFGIKDLIHQEKPENVTLVPIKNKHHEMALELIKRHYLSEHVLIRARNMDISDDRALDEYLINILKQGNSIFIKTDDDTVAGLCVNFASSAVDPRNLRNYAFYRQDPNTKDFLYFTAKLQETPNFWKVFQQQKIFEIKMLTVLPEFRRQGIAVMLVEKSKEQARDQGYNVVRMDCINPYDYKIAERCMLQCLLKFPLHKLRGANAPYIKRTSDHNRFVRVYAEVRLPSEDTPHRTLIHKRLDLESLIE